VKSEFWPVEEVDERGYGMAVFNTEEIRYPIITIISENGIQGILDKGRRNARFMGLHRCMGLGNSRCMDYLVTDNDVKEPTKSPVVGHSCGWENALWQALKTRAFALVNSNHVGLWRAALSRRQYGETIARINRVFSALVLPKPPELQRKRRRLPVDMHMLVALIAPRAVNVRRLMKTCGQIPEASIFRVPWRPGFINFCKRNKLSRNEAPLNKQFASGKMAYHVVEGPHDMTLKDWTRYMDFADVIFK
jgi:hypothetical protein